MNSINNTKDVPEKKEFALHRSSSEGSVVSETTATSSDVVDAEKVSKWDLKTQTPHGGQEWSEIGNLVEDFSVTTNGLGPVPGALEAAKEALLTIEHYPPSDFEPAITDLAEFLSPHDSADMRSRLLLGNGASEMIDMISRLAPKGPWRPGPLTTQYQEYRRSATNAGRAELHWSDVGAKLTSIVNPCNPTGDYMHVEEIKEYDCEESQSHSVIRYISKTCDDNSWVVVDESMQPWAGPHWREDSLTSQKEFIQEIQRKRGISVYVIHSWTKIWACPGIRLGSVVCPTAEDASAIKKMQVPWSVNVMALHYLSGCCKADEYMQRTWKLTVEWRSFITDGLKHINFPGVYGEAWSSWIWIDTGSEDLAEAIVGECKAAGVPIRWGKFGYCMPTYVRLGVRKPSSAKVLINTIDRVVEEHRCASQ